MQSELEKVQEQPLEDGRIWNQHALQFDQFIAASTTSLDTKVSGTGRYTLPPKVNLLKPVDIVKIIEDDRYNA